MICTPAERDLIVAGATRLVAPGDHPDWCSGNPHESECECWGTPRVAPQRWVDATGPCPTDTDGDGDCQRCFKRQRPPDCIDGRKREALQVECPVCASEGEGRWCLVTFAYATVEVLPVVDGNRDEHDVEKNGPAVMVFDPPYTQPETGEVWTTALYVAWGEYQQITLDPLPVAGRDWVVLLDNVEVLA